MPQDKSVDTSQYDIDRPHYVTEVYTGKGQPPAWMCPVCDVYVPDEEVLAHIALPPSFRSAKAPLKSV